MIFAFVDESGKPYPSEADIHPTLTAVCCKGDYIKELTQKLYNAEIRVFGDDPTFNRQLKGNKMINLQLNNKKLVDRGTRMLVEELQIPYNQANALLLLHGSVKKAVDIYKNEHP